MVGNESVKIGEERRFPDNPWAAVVADDPIDGERLLRTAAASAVARGGPPCDLALGRDYLKAHAPAGECWIYACGTHSQGIIDILESDARVRIAGFVDAKAASIGRFLGYPVITPQELPARTFDHVIVGHLYYEFEFVEVLRDQGIAEGKIFRVYGNETYWKTAVAEYVSRITAEHPGPYDTVIVTNNSVVVSDDELLSVFDKNRTMVLYYGLPSIYYESSFRMVTVGKSLDLMYRLLEYYTPRNIYIRTFFDEACIVHSIRQRCKEAVVIHELFDMSTVFPDSLLTEWNKWSSDKIRTLRHAEWNTFRTSDFVISKRGGACWKRILAPFDVPYATVFSRLLLIDKDKEKPDTLNPIKIVYAGYLPPEARHLGGYYDLYPCFEQLVNNDDIIVDIYNAGHPHSGHCDDIYNHYLIRDYGGRINYFRSKPYGELIETLSGYSFGWLYNERSETYIYDAAVTIPGRVTGYISAGLPVIIDDEFEFLSGLITEFNAGIVVPDGRTDLIPDLVRRADQMVLRVGARRLRDYMVAQNQDAFRRLRVLMQQPA